MSHTNLLFHIVFATKDRLPMITNDLKPELHAYIFGTAIALGAKAIAIGGIADHVHLFIRLKPNIALSNFMRELKSTSSAWARRKTKGKFSWQARYGAFTVSQSQAETIKRYIRNQEQHHKKAPFTEEYKSFLKANEIHFEEKYLWN